MWFDPSQLAKSQSCHPATSATSATSATFEADETIRPSKSQESQKSQAPSLQKNTAHAATYWHWLLHFADREPLEIYCHPDADFDGVMRQYPDAVAAEPFELIRLIQKGIDHANH